MHDIHRPTFISLTALAASFVIAMAILIRFRNHSIRRAQMTVKPAVVAVVVVMKDAETAETAKEQKREIAFWGASVKVVSFLDPLIMPLSKAFGTRIMTDRLLVLGHKKKRFTTRSATRVKNVTTICSGRVTGAHCWGNVVRQDLPLAALTTPSLFSFSCDYRQLRRRSIVC